MEKKRKKRGPFKVGLFMGLIWPVLLIGGVAGLIYRFTARLPFPVRRAEEGELVIGLISPEEIPTYWQRWRDELAPFIERAQSVLVDLRGTSEISE